MDTIRSFLFNTLCSFPAVLIAITVQGYAKAKMSDKLGDKLPRFQGRVTLNPSAHIDLIGFILLILVHFGWTKPIETNPTSYKNRKKDTIKVEAAPLIGNLITAIIFAIIYVLVVVFALPYIQGSMGDVLNIMLRQVVLVNISIMVFNLFPLPGLCGWNIFKAVNPKGFFKVSGSIYKNQGLIFLIILLFGSVILTYPVQLIYNAIIYPILYLVQLFI